MPSYAAGTKDLHDIIKRVCNAHHPDLKKAKVTFAPLFVHAAEDAEGDPKGAAIVHQGREVLAKTRVINVRDRVHGLADIEIMVDGDRWEELDDAQQEALIDQQLESLELRRENESGEVILDDIGRPKIIIRPPDFIVAGYRAVCERHGVNAPEVIAMRKVEEDYGQIVFQWHAEKPARSSSTKTKNAAA